MYTLERLRSAIAMIRPYNGMIRSSFILDGWTAISGSCFRVSR